MYSVLTAGVTPVSGTTVWTHPPARAAPHCRPCAMVRIPVACR